MFNWLRKRKQQAKEAKQKEQFNSGYDWAAGSLLRGDLTVAFVEDKADYSFDGNYSYFDAGASKAVIKLTEINFLGKQS